MILLLKGTRVSETTLFRHSLKADVSTDTNLVTAKLDVIAYRGNDPNPKWLDVESGTCTDCTSVGERSPSSYLPSRHVLQSLHGDCRCQICIEGTPNPHAGERRKISALYVSHRVVVRIDGASSAAFLGGERE